MKAEESLALIFYRLERSSESLRAAEIMFENGMLAFSMNRVYYAMFYAVQALLVSLVIGGHDAASCPPISSVRSRPTSTVK